MPKVSVVIPAYNAMTYLPETVASVLQQTFSDFELIIVNDGSSDNIVEWVSGLEDPRVKIISQENRGVAAARNTGIAHAQGEYIAFLDADDLWEPTKLEKQTYCLDNNPPVGLVYTWTALIDQWGRPTRRVWNPHIEGNVWEHIVVNDMISTGSSPMIRSKCFEAVGVFDPTLASCEDRDMWTRIAVHYPFALVKEFLTFYRRHAHNMTNQHQKIIQTLRQVIEKTFQSAPLELLHLRNQSYGHMNLCQAWSSVDQKNYKEALHYKQQALLHYPQLKYSGSHMRLSLALTMTRLFGPQGYDGVRNLARTVRCQILGSRT
jgi:glycosyltransferase involved in cell wall biosynthesis